MTSRRLPPNSLAVSAGEGERGGEEGQTAAHVEEKEEERRRAGYLDVLIILLVSSSEPEPNQ